MDIIIENDYATLSRRIASDTAALLNSFEQPLFCPTSGDTPAGLYAELVQLQSANNMHFSNCLFVGLDEWLGMNGSDEGSCRYSLDRQFFFPAGISNQQICFFDGKATDPIAECARIEQYIAANGGLDLAVVGLGLNGHVGMNEPGTPADIRSHVSNLAPQTIATGQKYFNKPTPLTQGLTLGLGTLLEAKHIFLMVNGSKKANIVQKVVEGHISADVPATLLKQHPSFTIYLDKSAAVLIEDL